MQEQPDGVIILLLFAVRIGVPIVLTLAFGYWLERQLRPPEEKHAMRAEMERLSRQPSPKVVRLQCWNLMHCDSAQRAQCATSRYPDLPCWLALQVDGSKVREECFTCQLYTPEALAA